MQTLLETIKDAESRKVAIGHFNVSETTGLNAIVKAAIKLDVPIVIGVSEGEAEFIGINEIVALVRSVRKNKFHEIYLNADHMKSIEKVKAVAEAGYDSVIFDAAHVSFEENVIQTKNAVDIAKAINPDILVEGELGYIGTSSKLLDEIPEGAAVTGESMTTPEQAREFVERTGVDLLSPAIGEIHGLMRHASHPRLDIDRIKKIYEVAQVPLVLHGGSGIADGDFQKAIEAGMSTIHINTEIRVAWRRGVESALKRDKEEVAPYKILSDPSGKYINAEKEIYDVVLKRLRLFNRLM